MFLAVAFLFPMIAGAAASLVRLADEKKRNWLYAAVMAATVILGTAAAFSGSRLYVLQLAERVSLSFAFDGMGRYFLAAVLVLYTAACLYSFEYMKMEEHPEMFFLFFFVSLGAMMAVCMAQNLVTLYLCFELATLTSMPLVLHEMTKEAVTAGLKYLFYSVGGALLGLLAVFFVYYYSSTDAGFVLGGFLDGAKTAGHEGLLLAVVFLGIVGFGAKAGMYPMHGWLPAAHPVAPAPGSALLSGIIAKAGILAVIRLVYYSVGTSFLAGTWVQTAWMVLALLTVFMGSMMAFGEKVLKKRLAYSTVSQISYIMFALSTLSLEGLRGGMLHVMHHMASKGCLFLAAGAFIYMLGKRKVGELKGVGRRMPVTLWCFFIVSLSLVGIPPMGGFLSKWVIASAAIGNAPGAFAVAGPVILLVSALLTAGYLFPIVVDGFFPGAGYRPEGGWKEAPAVMTVPMMVLCAAALMVGMFGNRFVTVLGGMP